MPMASPRPHGIRRCRSRRRAIWSRLRSGALGLLLGAAAALDGHAAETPPTIAVLPIKLLDTSGEPTDQAPQHGVRLARMADDLAADLTRTGRYRATVLPAAVLERDCPTGKAACLLEAARRQGAALVFVGVVHKSSTLILQIWARLADVHTGRDVFSRDLNFRGDTDEAWQRAETFLVAQIRDTDRSRGD